MSLLMSQMNQSTYPDAEHIGIKCVKCGMDPIRGPRFKCYECQDFNICQLCELSDTHSDDHSIIKIKRPECDPLRRKEERIEKEVVLQNPLVNPDKQLRLHEEVKSNSKAKAKLEFKSKFICENFSDSFQVEQGKQFIKSWTFKNTGLCAWP